MIPATLIDYTHPITKSHNLIVALAGCPNQCPGCRQGDPRYANGALFTPQQLGRAIVALYREGQHDRLAFVGGDVLSREGIEGVLYETITLPRKLTVSATYCREITLTPEAQFAEFANAVDYLTEPREGLVIPMRPPRRKLDVSDSYATRALVGASVRGYTYPAPSAEPLLLLDNAPPGLPNPLPQGLLEEAMREAIRRGAYGLTQCNLDLSVEDMAPEAGRVVHPGTGLASVMVRTSQRHFGQHHMISWQTSEAMTMYAFDTLNGEYLFSRPFVAAKIDENASVRLHAMQAMGADSQAA